MTAPTPKASPETAARQGIDLPGAIRRGWSAAWPKLAAIALGLGVWEAGYVYLQHVNPIKASLKIGPADTLPALWEQMHTTQLYSAIALTMGRAALGYAVALAFGLALGVAIVRSQILRRAFGSLITGLQTMPSIAWFPLAIVLFSGKESAITFVVVLGAAPSIANAVILGVDHVPPELVRAGRVLGARGIGLYRRVVLPATLPSLVGGMKQGWAFAWRSLMAGELLVIVPGHGSIGVRLQNYRDLGFYSDFVATMIVILVIGIVMDSVFALADRRIRARRGLLNQAL